MIRRPPSSTLFPYTPLFRSQDVDHPPLRALAGVQMLAGAAPGEGAQRRLIDIPLKESQRLARTLKGFLRFAPPRERTPVAFDIGPLLAGNMELLGNSEEGSPPPRLELVVAPPSP